MSSNSAALWALEFHMQDDVASYGQVDISLNVLKPLNLFGLEGTLSLVAIS